MTLDTIMEVLQVDEQLSGLHREKLDKPIADVVAQAPGEYAFFVDALAHGMAAGYHLTLQSPAACKRMMREVKPVLAEIASYYDFKLRDAPSVWTLERERKVKTFTLENVRNVHADDFLVRTCGRAFSISDPDKLSKELVSFFQGHGALRVILGRPKKLGPWSAKFVEGFKRGIATSRGPYSLDASLHGGVLTVTERTLAIRIPLHVYGKTGTLPGYGVAALSAENVDTTILAQLTCANTIDTAYLQRRSQVFSTVHPLVVASRTRLLAASQERAEFVLTELPKHGPAPDITWEELTDTLSSPASLEYVKKQHEDLRRGVIGELLAAYALERMATVVDEMRVISGKPLSHVRSPQGKINMRYGHTGYAMQFSGSRGSACEVDVLALLLGMPLAFEVKTGQQRDTPDHARRTRESVYALCGVDPTVVQLIMNERVDLRRRETGYNLKLPWGGIVTRLSKELGGYE
jgi:hypothetical protein